MLAGCLCDGDMVWPWSDMLLAVKGEACSHQFLQTLQLQSLTVPR